MKRQEGFPGQVSYIIPESIQELIIKNPLISDLYLTDVGYYPNARYHFRERTSGSSQTILIYSTSGKGFVKIDNTEHELHADSFIIIPKEKTHAYYSDVNNPWSIYWIHLGGKKTDLFSNYSSKIIPIERGKDSRINVRLDLFEEIFRNLERGFGTDTLEYINLTLNYLLVSFTHVARFRLINSEKEKDPVAQSVNYMLENLNKTIRLEELANMVQLSTSHFSRLFVTKTNQSPIDYFNQLKIQKACRLLDISNLSISEIAGDLGYEDPFYFSRIFKKLMGISPRDFRKNL